MNRQLWVRFPFINDDPNDRHMSSTIRSVYKVTDPEAEYMVVGVAGSEFLILIGDQIANIFPRHIRVTRNEPIEFIEEEGVFPL